MLLSECLQELKVSDFGLCRYFSTDSLTTGRGREKYMATEVRKNSKMHRSHPFACDDYSWALYCYYVLTGIESNKPQANKLPTVIRQRVVPNTNRALAAFLSAAISDNAADRPTIAEYEVTLKDYRKNCKGALFSLSIKNVLFRFASADLR